MPTPSEAPQASVIVVAYNGAAVLPACLRTLGASRGVSFEIVVVDNGSSDGSGDLVERDFPLCRLIRNDRNLGFAGGNNVGIQAAHGRFIVLLNQDTEVRPEWLAQIIEPFADDPRIGAVGCKLLYPGGEIIQHAGGAIYPNAATAHFGCGVRDEGQWDKAKFSGYVTGAALALRREAIEEIGLLDEGFFPAYFEEFDWQTRLWRADWKVFYTPTCGVIHHESQVLGAGSSRFVYLYTYHRLRYLALNGTPGGVWPGLRHELLWFLSDVLFNRRLAPVLKAYVNGVVHWRVWRSERFDRPHVPRLSTPGETPDE